MTTDRAIEAAARGLHDAETNYRWEHEPEWSQNVYQRRARAALESGAVELAIADELERQVCHIRELQNRAESADANSWGSADHYMAIAYDLVADDLEERIAQLRAEVSDGD